jgi:ribosome-associated protein
MSSNPPQNSFYHLENTQNMNSQQHDDNKIATLNSEYIELDKLLKRENLAASGGEAKYLVSQGVVQVNGEIETRKRRKLYAGDLVSYDGINIRIAAK